MSNQAADATVFNGRLQRRGARVILFQTSARCRGALESDGFAVKKTKSIAAERDKCFTEGWCSAQ